MRYRRKKTKREILLKLPGGIYSKRVGGGREGYHRAIADVSKIVGHEEGC
jgi:hypothetical protein